MAATDTDEDRFFKANAIFFTTAAAVGPFVEAGYRALQRAVQTELEVMTPFALRAQPWRQCKCGNGNFADKTAQRRKNSASGQKKDGKCTHNKPCPGKGVVGGHKDCPHTFCYTDVKSVKAPGSPDTSPCHCEAVAKIICDHKIGGTAPSWSQSDPRQWLEGPNGHMELAKLYIGKLTKEFDVVGQAPAPYVLAKTVPAHFAGDSLVNMARFCNAFAGGTYADAAGVTRPIFSDAVGDPMQIDVSRWEAAGNARNHAIGHVPTGTGNPELSVHLYEELRNACLVLLNDPVFLKMPPSSRDGPAAAIAEIGNVDAQPLPVSKADIERIRVDQQQVQTSLQAIEAEVQNLNTTIMDQMQQMKDGLKAKFDSESKFFNAARDHHLAQGKSIDQNVNAVPRQYQETHDASMQRLDTISDAMSTDMQRAARLLTELGGTSDRHFEQVKGIARDTSDLLGDLERAKLQVSSMMRAEHEHTRHRVDQAAAKIQLHTVTVAAAESAASKRLEADLLGVDAAAIQKKQAILREAAKIEEMKLPELKQVASGLGIKLSEPKGDKRKKTVWINAIRSKQSELAVGADTSDWSVGTISSWGSKGFGFVTPDGGGDAIFCHIKALNASTLCGSLVPTIGTRVEFSTEPGNNGQPRVAQTRSAPTSSVSKPAGVVTQDESATRRTPEPQQHCTVGLDCKTYGCQHSHPYGRPKDCKFGARCRFIGTNSNGYPCRFLHPGNNHVAESSSSQQQYSAPPRTTPQQQQQQQQHVDDDIAAKLYSFIDLQPKKTLSVYNMDWFYSSLPFADQQRTKDAIGRAATGKGLKKFVADRPQRFKWDPMANTVSLVIGQVSYGGNDDTETKLYRYIDLQPKKTLSVYNMSQFYASLPFADQQRTKDVIGRAATGKGLKKFVADRPLRFAWDQMTNTVSLVGADGGDPPQRVDQDQMTTTDSVVLSLDLIPSSAEWPQLSPAMVNAAVNRRLGIVTKNTTFEASTRHPGKRVATVALGSSSDFQTAMAKTAAGESVMLHNKFTSQSFQLIIYTDQENQQLLPQQPHQQLLLQQQHPTMQHAAHPVYPFTQTAPLQQGQASGAALAGPAAGMASPLHPQQQADTQHIPGQWPQLHTPGSYMLASVCGDNANQPHAGGVIGGDHNGGEQDTGTPDYEAAYEQFLAETVSLTVAADVPTLAAGQQVEARFKPESKSWKLATVVAAQPEIGCYILEFDGYQDLQKGIPPQRIRIPPLGRAGTATGPQV